MICEREKARAFYLLAYCWGEVIHNEVDELVCGNIRILGTDKQRILILVVSYQEPLHIKLSGICNLPMSVRVGVCVCVCGCGWCVLVRAQTHTQVF